jgi:hypothetical protein
MLRNLRPLLKAPTAAARFPRVARAAAVPFARGLASEAERSPVRTHSVEE